MIECKNTCVRIGKKEIVHDVSFCCNDGTVTVIAGKNGCGKTSLIKAVCGIYKYGGSIYTDGSEVSHQKHVELAGRISVMPQILPRPAVSVEELVSYARSPYTGLSGVMSPNDILLCEKAINTVGISHIKHQSVASLSGGEQRKAFFAMLLAQNTKSILLDEPCANLDAEYTRKIFEIIRILKSENKAIIVVLHDINAALELADNIIFMQNGSCVFQGTPHRAIENNIPQKVFSLSKCCAKDDNGKEFIFYK